MAERATASAAHTVAGLDIVALSARAVVVVHGAIGRARGVERGNPCHSGGSPLPGVFGREPHDQRAWRTPFGGDGALRGGVDLRPPQLAPS
jgi:hypothetical protein